MTFFNTYVQFQVLIIINQDLKLDIGADFSKPVGTLNLTLSWSIKTTHQPNITEPVLTLLNKLWPNSHWSEWWCWYTGGNTVWPASHRISTSIDYMQQIGLLWCAIDMRIQINLIINIKITPMPMRTITKDQNTVWSQLCHTICMEIHKHC